VLIMLRNHRAHREKAVDLIVLADDLIGGECDKYPLSENHTNFRLLA